LAQKPWGGRFKKGTNKLVEEYTSSIHIDKRLYREDIEGSIAHAKMLGKQGIIPKQESQKIVKALEEIRGEIERGKFRFREELEDIHLNIEKRLIEKIGDLGGKLHTARSRNDQIALDERLYLRHEIGEILSLIKTIEEDLLSIVEKHINAVMPAYTHLQRAQPVLLSHHLLAYFEMFKRDRERYLDCLKRVNIMPLGAGAGAGTSFSIDRHYVAELLHFPQVSRNSVDAVSDRDFVMEFISTSAILIAHLSRLSEEFVLWSSKEFDFIDLGDEFTTGSSIMPQKRNPDVSELIRGKTGRIYGNLMAILTLMKGLPLSYNRDMQEDKEPAFDTVDTVKISLHVLSEMIKSIKFKPENMKRALSHGFITATDLADYLAKKGMPFRQAHEVTGKIVRYAEEKGRELTQLSISELRMFSSLFVDDVYDQINIEGSISSRKSYGGTARENVLRMIQECKKEIASW
jgi:argininosuccinate lyase